MKTLGFTVILLVGVGLSAQQVLASSSISTRVKVVEEKVRLHDKKLRELSAQQELTNKQIAQLQLARIEAEKAMVAKAEADKQAAQAKAIIKQRPKPAKAQEVVAEVKTKPPIQLHSDPASYAFP
jgi:hypothetical protein